MQTVQLDWQASLLLPISDGLANVFPPDLTIVPIIHRANNAERSFC